MLMKPPTYDEQTEECINYSRSSGLKPIEKDVVEEKQVLKKKIIPIKKRG